MGDTEARDGGGRQMEKATIDVLFFSFGTR